MLAALAGACAAAALVSGAEWMRRDVPPRPWPAGLRLLGRLGRRVGAPAAPDLAARIAAAGLERHVTASEVTAAKGGGGLAVALGVAPLLVGSGRGGALLALGACAGAFLLPDAVLRRRTRTRMRRCAADLADVLDLLRVATAAGMPVARAMGEIGRRHPGLLAAEMRRCAGEIALGVAHATALAGLRARCPLPAVAALVAAIGRADRHGAPVGPALVALAVDARSERARLVADRAARAAPKIQLVVALLLVPSVLLVVGAALLPAVGLAD